MVEVRRRPRRCTRRPSRRRSAASRWRSLGRDRARGRAARPRAGRSARGSDAAATPAKLRAAAESSAMPPTSIISIASSIGTIADADLRRERLHVDDDEVDAARCPASASSSSSSGTLATREDAGVDPRDGTSSPARRRAMATRSGRSIGLDLDRRPRRAPRASRRSRRSPTPSSRRARAKGAIPSRFATESRARNRLPPSLAARVAGGRRAPLAPGLERGTAAEYSQASGPVRDGGGSPVRGALVSSGTTAWPARARDTRHSQGDPWNANRT